MLTMLATLPFMIVLAVAGLAIAHTVKVSGDKILAALKGESLLAKPVLSTRPITVRMSARPERVRVRPAQSQWRAAA